jgi:predicted enzyme related to lactoylglutathione lyase
MSERSDYSPGEFSWVSLASPDTDESARFYGELLGWESAEAGPPEETGGYRFFVRGGKQVAGLSPIQDEGQPPAWISYVCVADADETAEKVKEAGGAVMMDPMDVLEVGRMAVFADPAGAPFSVWQPKQHRGAQLVNEVGSWTWNQLITRNLEGAKEFYGRVFGWDVRQVEEAPPDSPYWMWQVEGQKWEEGIAGMMSIGDEMPADTPPHWQVYFAVENAEAALETTKRRGGAVLFGPQRIPVGTLAVLLDPQGANFAILEPDYPEAR